MNFRPVIEQWGSSSDNFLAPNEVEQIIEDIASEDAAAAGKVETQDYGEVRSIWIENGGKFLDFITQQSPVELYEMFSDWDQFDKDDTLSLLGNMHSFASEWRTMIDPKDGSLRFYIDQY
jgi:hypothetical protein